ncbi:MAG: hypothetical protein LBB75_01755 [Oscillospiraceae bacterium]|jgi:hypothetical protein|nr:hypothetical protein [Oscillospiraceae bacterium]
MISNYGGFVRELLAAGFSQFGGSRDSVATLFRYGWNNQPEDSPVEWHCSDPDRDPWQWRQRVLERGDIAYSKVFFRKHGFITREWYPYFLAVRRRGRDFGDAYADGLHSRAALRVYECLQQNGALPVHEIKPLAEFRRDEKAAFERALVELEMGLHITVCGHAQKISRAGESYGWASDVYCLTEEFFPEEVFSAASLLNPKAAADKIEGQVYRLNPEAEPKRVRKFIFG